ncbi:MAG TPA: hypothetical protein VLJ68_03160, partial [Chitinophagaceae bacterium]|nr:hypothetical protein [Chitinophagaceae bacterium]
MKKGRPIFQLLSFMLIVVCSSHPANGQIEGKWTGTISFHEKFEGITGKSEKKINVSVTDNRCRGTITYEDDGGGAVKGKTSCHGQGEVEFVTLIINRNDSIYTIETEGPTCSEGSNPWTRGQGNDILIADKPLGINPNILSGVDTKVSQLPANMGTVTTTISWQLSQAAPAFELIITPVNYDNWLPEPGMDELKKGTVMEIGLKVQGRNGAPLTLKAEKFEIRLSNTSREPGITLNAPLYPNVQQLPDLRLLPLAIAESKAEDQFITINCTDGSTGKVFIGSYDGGGWTTLTVVAVMKDRSTIRGNLLVAGGETEIPIPKRTSESVIATAWLNDHGNPKDIDDIERSNGNANNGDGLTAYEGYRGFIS